MKPASKGIDIVAYVGNRVFSRVIQWRSGSKFSHVGMVCECDGVEYVLESLEGKGVRLVPLTHWLTWPGKIVGWKLDPNIVGDVDRQNMVDWCVARLGCEYASPKQFLRSFGYSSRWLMRLLHLRIDLEFDRFFCSEYLSQAMESVGLVLPKYGSEMTPGDVTKLPFLINPIEIKT